MGKLLMLTLEDKERIKKRTLEQDKQAFNLWQKVNNDKHLTLLDAWLCACNYKEEQNKELLGLLMQIERNKKL